MLRGAAQDAVDLRRDPLDVAKQDVRIFRRLATESMTPEPLRQTVDRFLRQRAISDQCGKVMRLPVTPVIRDFQIRQELVA